MRQTYLTLYGEVLDLSGLNDNERAFFDRCIQAWYNRVRRSEYSALLYSSENPALADTQGRVTREVWATPLWQACRDLEDRVGVAQGEIAPSPGTDPET